MATKRFLLKQKTTRKRFPRFLVEKTNFIPPYDPYAAEGFTLLKLVGNGCFVQTDKYITHAKLKSGDTLVLTNKRAIVFNNKYSIKWRKCWSQIDGDPCLHVIG